MKKVRQNDFMQLTLMTRIGQFRKETYQGSTGTLLTNKLSSEFKKCLKSL